MPSLILVKPATVPAGEFDLSGGPQVIGRLPAECQICLNAPAVSKRHAVVTAEGGRFFVTDENSHNGTLLNGAELKPHVRTPLAAGDELVICSFHLVFHEGDDLPTGPPAAALPAGATPEERLAALLAVRADAGAGALAPVRALVAETLFSGTAPDLARIADALLGVLPHAERCRVVAPDEHGWPVPRVTRAAAGAPADARFARSLAVRALETFEAVIADTLPGPGRPDPRSVLCVPLAAADGRPLGAVLLDARDRARPFAAADLRLAAAIASLAGVALEKARMHEAVQARERELRDLAVAQDVQKQFLPKYPPTLPGYEFYAHYQTAHQVGGDYYDFIALQDGRLAIVVADVSGKGVPAALLVAKLSSDVRTSLLRTSDLAQAVRALNRQLSDGPLGDEHYVTLVVMVLDRARHALTVVNAGHPSPKRHRAATGALADLLTTDAGGQPLGWDRDYPYTAVTVALEPNDTVTAFTDGVSEALSPQGAPFGDAAVARCLTPGPLPADAGRPGAAGSALRHAVYKHLGSRPQSDDIAIVSFGRWEPGDHQTTVMH